MQPLSTFPRVQEKKTSYSLHQLEGSLFWTIVTEERCGVGDLMISSRKKSEDEKMREGLERYLNGLKGRYNLEEGESFILQHDGRYMRVWKMKGKAVVELLPEDPP